MYSKIAEISDSLAKKTGISVSAFLFVGIPSAMLLTFGVDEILVAAVCVIGILVLFFLEFADSFAKTLQFIVESLRGAQMVRGEYQPASEAVKPSPYMEILSQGIEAWNSWREENPEVWPVLEGAKLRGANLKGANLAHAGLECAKLRGANLKGADLAHADLRHANLADANLGNASLTNADLTCANLKSAILERTMLESADLVDADLRRANLEYANLSGANLMGANLAHADLAHVCLSGAILAFTGFIDVDLSEAEGIEEVRHDYPSSVGTDTLELTAQGLASNPSRQGAVERFLRGAGVAEHGIAYFRSLLGKPIEFYSSFISYSHADKDFARRMYDSLQGRGIRCWLDEHDVTVGAPIQEAIDRGFKVTEKVLLCCSEHSLTSTWVLREVTKAFAKEEHLSKQTGKPCYVLIPLDIDGHLFKKDGDGGFVWDHGWSGEVRNRIAADFTGWKDDNDKFEDQFDRVVKALRADAGAREADPESKL